MSTKKILFEGQDVSLGPTMQKLQRQAETMHQRNLEGISKEVSSTKELKKQLEEQISLSERKARIVGKNINLEIQEEYKKRKELAERLEREEEERLRKKGVRGSALQTQMETYRRDVTEPRLLAAQDIRSTREEELRNQTEEQKTTNLLLREILNQDTKQWEQEVQLDRRNVERFVQQARKAGFDTLPPEQRAKALFQQALLAENQGGGRGGGMSVLKDILGAGLIRDFGSIIGQMPGARDAFDLIPGLTRISGGLLGAGVGAGAGAVAGLASVTPDPGKGAIAGATLGGEVGQRAGEIAGSALSRFFNERENLERSTLGFRAVTGMNVNSSTVPRVNQFGFSTSEAFQIAKEMALRSGSSENDVMSLLGAETGFGIDRGALMSFSGTRRRTGQAFGGSLSSLLGRAESGGVDRVLFNELIQNQTQLINVLGNMSDTVNPENIASVILEMNKIGGGFSVRDPRSMGFIQSLQGGLTSPNEFGRAMNLSVLRNINPNASLLDLLSMEEQGLGGESGREFLRGTVNQFSKMFGDEDLTVLALRSRFPGIPISDLRRLARGENIIGTMESSGETADLQGQGNVSTRAIMQATVTDAFATGAIEGMQAVEQQMTGLFTKVFEEAMKNVDLTETIKSAIPTNWQRYIPGL